MNLVGISAHQRSHWQVTTQEKIMAWIKPLKSFTGYLSADSLYVANDFFSAKKWLRIRQIYANI